jgi:hypothetical protein
MKESRCVHDSQGDGTPNCLPEEGKERIEGLLSEGCQSRLSILKKNV